MLYCSDFLSFCLYKNIILTKLYYLIIYIPSLNSFCVLFDFSLKNFFNVKIYILGQYGSGILLQEICNQPKKILIRKNNIYINVN